MCNDAEKRYNTKITNVNKNTVLFIKCNSYSKSRTMSFLCVCWWFLQILVSSRSNENVVAQNL